MTALSQLDAQTQAYLPRIVEIVRQALGGTPCSAWLFGSRATGRATPVSDFDLAFGSPADLASVLAKAREALEESTIPFRVDLVDLAEASAAMVDQVQRKGVPLWTS